MKPSTASAPDTIAGHLAARCEDPRPGLVFGDRSWSWSAVVGEAAVRASLLAGLRRPGPFHVGVLLENLPEYAFTLFGAALAGATIVGINPTRRGQELANDIRHTDCQLILTNADLLGLIEGLDLAPSDRVLDVEGRDYQAMLADHQGVSLPSEMPRPDALYLLLFTAGSTGAPKAVRVTQGRAARTAAESARAFGPDDVLYCSMPLFHGNALLANLFPALVSGASVVLRRRFSASAFSADIRRYGCTYFNYVGRTLSYILAVPESPEDTDNRLRWALGSEASPQSVAEFQRRFGCPVFEGYGSSENAVVIAPVPGTPAGALGRPREGMDVAIVDPLTGEDCAVARLDEQGRLANPSEAIGEIVGRNTAGLFEGYYENPEAEAERRRNGWYWTGDLGYRDAEGFIYFAGRSTEWLRVDGENFAAGAVERILNRYPQALGSAVYAVPDPVSGDQVMAALEVAFPEAFDPEDFERFLIGQPDLGTKWAPRFVRVTRSLPVGATGKLDKLRLRAEAWGAPEGLWWRPMWKGEGLGFRPLTAEDRYRLRCRFEESGRAHLLPAGC